MISLSVQDKKKNKKHTDPEINVKKHKQPQIRALTEWTETIESVLSRWDDTIDDLQPKASSHTLHSQFLHQSDLYGPADSGYFCFGCSFFGHFFPICVVAIFSVPMKIRLQGYEVNHSIRTDTKRLKQLRVCEHSTEVHWASTAADAATHAKNTYY